jgi:hypothetical protein
MPRRTASERFAARPSTTSISRAASSPSSRRMAIWVVIHSYYRPRQPVGMQLSQAHRTRIAGRLASILAGFRAAIGGADLMMALVGYILGSERGNTSRVGIATSHNLADHEHTGCRNVQGEPSLPSVGECQASSFTRISAELYVYLFVKSRAMTYVPLFASITHWTVPTGPLVEEEPDLAVGEDTVISTLWTWTM